MKPRMALVAAAAALTLACADWDNPVALADLEADVEFELSAATVQTFEEVEIEVHVMHGDASMHMRQMQLQIESAGDGTMRTIDLQLEGEGYAAHVTFFQPGEHHVMVMAMPERHHLMKQLHEHEVHVHRQHRTIGPYWVEMALDPAPVQENGTAHIELFTYELLSDGSRGNPVGGLDLEGAIHAPDGMETSLMFMEEEAAEYEAEFTFGGAGLYELHVEIKVGADHEEGEFHIPVLSPTTGDTGTGKPGGHGHGD